MSSMRTAGTLSADLPLRRDVQSDVASASAAVVVLLLAVLAIFALRFALRRGWAKWDWRRVLGGSAPQSGLRVVASMRLDARSSVHVVEWEGSRLLVARGEQAITLLATRDAPHSGGEESPDEQARP